MGLIEAIILAIIEGITEFLPISSTGHMIITSSIMGIASEDFTKTFTIAIQLGAILSVMVIYWRRFLQSFRFYLILLVAFIPAVIFGLLLGDWIDSVLERVDVVGFALLAGGIFLLDVDKIFVNNESNPSQEVSFKNAFLIGLFQCLAILLPGISRSAASIIGGLTQKLNRKTAAEFSFLLAVPTMFAATAYKLLKAYLNDVQFTGDQINLLIVGNAVAFIVAWIAIRSFIGFLTKHGFKVFGYYRIVVGLAILILYYSGYSFAML
jgi:undecaprenyl-diphosphatase